LASPAFCDLHTHSTASDGTLSPTALIEAAGRAKLAAVALTDHDTTVGLAAAAKCAQRQGGLTFVPGIEVSARFPGGTLHILGLGIDPADAGLAELTAHLRACRDERNPRMLAKLHELGLAIDMDDVRACLPQREGPEIVSRVHLAEALRRKGYVKDRGEAFDRYVGQGAAAYVEKERLSPARAVGAIRDAGGTAVLAHPVQLNYANHAHLSRILRELMDVGLNGIEAYHSCHSPEQTRLFLELAQRFGLVVTGGSDFHGQGKPDMQLGRPRVPLSVVGAAQVAQWSRASAS
jgi:predicted metal-dependent phosphoesterase TrpH